MQRKKRQLAISVTTLEAMHTCLAEQINLFCIEEPLYSKLQKHPISFDLLHEYEMTEYPDHRFILVKKVRGDHIFDDSKSEISYFRL